MPRAIILSLAIALGFAAQANAGVPTFDLPHITFPAGADGSGQIHTPGNSK